MLELYTELGSLALVAREMNLALPTIKNAMLKMRRRHRVRSTVQLAYLLGAGDLDES